MMRSALIDPILVWGCVAALLFILCGAVMRTGKGVTLLASKPNEKSRYDDRKLVRAVGGFFVAAGFVFIVILFGSALRMNSLIWGGLAVFMAGSVLFLVYIATSPRYRKEIPGDNGEKNTEN